MAEATTSEAIVTETADEKALAPRTMSTTLKKYRGQYEATVAYSGKTSLDNGKPVALALRGLSPSEVHQVAEMALGLSAGLLSERYATLNAGQQRMNSGNRLANALKKGNVSLETIKAAVEVVVNEREEVPASE